MNNKWSEIGQLRSSLGEDIFCANCRYKLIGQRICPNCGSTIIYSGEDQNGIPNKWVLKDLQYKKNGNKLTRAGDAMSKAGTSMTLGCLTPIIFIFLIIIILLIL